MAFCGCWCLVVVFLIVVVLIVVFFIVVVEEDVAAFCSPLAPALTSSFDDKRGWRTPCTEESMFCRSWMCWVIKDLSIDVDLFTLNFLLCVPYVGQYIALTIAIKYCRTGIHTGTYDRNFRVWSCILELSSYKRETLPLFLFTATHTGQITKNFWEVCLL